MARPDTERDAPANRGAGTRTAAKQGVEANARLTGSTAAVIFVLLAAEGPTIVRIIPLLRWHVFLGMVLVPPVLLKIGSACYRFVRYYAGSPAYRRKGPPPALLRLLGPFVVALTVIVLASGVALLFDSSARGTLLFVHRASFLLWFGAMAIHVLGHLFETARLVPGDYYWRTRRQVAGAGLRQWGIAASLAIGALLGVLLLTRVGPFLVS